MGKKAKVGKARKDKFYHLAKETGYRSRAAFKLIQLNRKYEFLQRSNVIVDLCAAPGGWLQVAAENAPMSNHIIGIDLVPIPPIRNVTTLQEDITTERCRMALKKELHTAKADCFLNDGAPNVGKNWLHDAYLQAELTLHAMKLATEYLRKGGWFVTKLFRSKDYDAIMWVFQQMFKEVHATKPQASRNESAEIFVVCQGFFAPDKIDPKFLDPKYVFQEVDKTQRASIDLIHPEKKKRQREGYAEGDYTLFHSLKATEFLESDDFMDLLAQASEIVLDTVDIRKHPLTTAEIRECAKDIKVLGKKEIKALFLWRKKVKTDLEKKKGKDEKDASKPSSEGDENGEAGDSEEEMEEENEAEMEELENLLEKQNEEELKSMKKAKKKVQKAQAKQKARIDLKMVIPGDRPDIQDDINIFDLQKIKSRKDLATVEAGDLSHMDGEDMFEESDDEDARVTPRVFFDRRDKQYVGIGEETDEEDMEDDEDDDTLFDNKEREDEEEEDEDAEEEEEEEEVDDEQKEQSNEIVQTKKSHQKKSDVANPLVVDMGEKSRIRRDKQSLWFKKDSFAGLEDDLDDEVELEIGSIAIPKKDKKTKTEKTNSTDENLDDSEPKSKSSKKQKIDETNFDSDEEFDQGSEKSDDDDDDSDSDDDSVYNFTQMIRTNKKKKTKTAAPLNRTKDGMEVAPLEPDLQLDEEGLAIGAAMVQSRKRRREIVDSGYHRYMFNDEHLPEWFVQDERKHMKRLRPVSKEEIEEYKLKAKAIDAQPIKKIAEAKARKKRKMMKRQEKARKKADAITDNVDTSEKEKWQQIKQIYKKAGLLNKKKPNVTYVVAKKGAGKKVRRPAGVKGQYKVVDKRMKKDMKAEKAQMKGKSKGKGGRGGGARKGKGSR